MICGESSMLRPYHRFLRLVVGTLAADRGVEAVECGDHGHAQGRSHRAEQRTGPEPGGRELKAPADGCRARRVEDVAE